MYAETEKVAASLAVECAQLPHLKMQSVIQSPRAASTAWLHV